MKAAIIATILALGTPALAGPCETNATNILRARREIVHYCERCGDKVPGLPEVLTNVDITNLDFAATYVRTSPAQYDNLAFLAGCHADGVSPILYVETEASGGVLITPARPASYSPPTHRTWTLAPRDPPFLSMLLGSLVGGCIVIAASRLRRAMKPRALDL